MQSVQERALPCDKCKLFAVTMDDLCADSSVLPRRLSSCCIKVNHTFAKIIRSWGPRTVQIIPGNRVPWLIDFQR